MHKSFPEEVQVLGQGLGIYSAATDASSLNTRNPPLRDTATLPKNGWVVLRFEADSPGVWVFHCHLFWWVQQRCMVALCWGVEVTNSAWFQHVKALGWLAMDGI